MEGVEQPQRRIAPRGLTSSRKEAVIAMVSEDRRTEARAFLRTAEENAVIFAKVSRSDQGFVEIERGIDEEGAAKFHQTWVVTVAGYGHASVAEHAVVQVDVENISSLAGDEITDNRIGTAFTEFSARFKGRQGMGYYTPGFIAEDPRLWQHWHNTHKRLFEITDFLTQRGITWILTEEAQSQFPQLKQGYYKSSETEKGWQSRLGKHSADQFKNLLPAGRTTSIGFSGNARAVENLLTKLFSDPHQEVREVGQDFKAAALEVAPTLVKFAEFNAYRASLAIRRETVINKYGLDNEHADSYSGVGMGRILDQAEALDQILAVFLFEHPDTGTFPHLLVKLSHYSTDEKNQMLRMIVANEVSFDDFERGEVRSKRGPYDSSPRAWEFSDGRVVWLPDMMYGDWRDFKRHRMQSYVAKPLSVTYGYFIPPLAELMDASDDPQFRGSVDLVREAILSMEELYYAVRKISRPNAQYAVTRFHFRPAIASFNFREAEHLIELRTGPTAHPFVRRLVWPIYDQLLQEYPGVFEHLHLRGERTKVAFP